MYCEQLHSICAQIPKFRFPFERSSIPGNGIYILFERGETGHNCERIVRVGTHTGNGQLPSRLQQHFIKEKKDRSILRKNIGRAILAHAGDPFLAAWEQDLTSRGARLTCADSLDLVKLYEVEKSVTAYIQTNFSFAVITVRDKEERLRLELRIISTVSLCEKCGPSRTWLGLKSPKEKIRRSGLWLVNELYKQPLEEADIEYIRFEAFSNPAST